jgi:hydroxyacylglutathione hydrolase
MKTPIVHIIPILQDNYCFILDNQDGGCVVIDPGQPEPVLYALNDIKTIPHAVLCTHHHPDHIAGAEVIKKTYSIPMIGPKKDSTNIPGLSHGVSEGDLLSYAGMDILVMETPGHTSGHCAFFEKTIHALFCGDTLFSMGCGRIMDGGGENLWESLQKIKKLPPDTQIYCGHEYTHSNGLFAQSVLGKTDALEQRMKDVIKLRENNLPTIPVSLETELKTNPFLLAQTLNEFLDLRRQKDRF